MAAIIRVEQLHVSDRDYLKAILMLQTRKGMVCSINLVQHTGDSKPSVSEYDLLAKQAVSRLLQADKRVVMIAHTLLTVKTPTRFWHQMAVYGNA